MDEYTTNLQARLDNILTDAYFGATAQRPRGEKGGVVPPPAAAADIDGLMVNILWFILGVILGGLLCYYAFYSSDETRDGDEVSRPK